MWRDKGEEGYGEGIKGVGCGGGDKGEGRVWEGDKGTWGVGR